MLNHSWRNPIWTRKLSRTTQMYLLVVNLKYLGKTIERVVSSQISDHVHANNLSDAFQSAYKPFHGMETALLCINNDILSAMDDGKITALVLLDLSAAFDTVDHKILLSRLQYHLGIHDIALDWCKSYLLNMPPTLVLVLVMLSPSLLLSTILYPKAPCFTVYTSPVRDIILKYNLNYHVYADDTQLYITFKSSQEPADWCITMLEKCIQEIRSWTWQNLFFY